MRFILHLFNWQIGIEIFADKISKKTRKTGNVIFI